MVDAGLSKEAELNLPTPEMIGSDYPEIREVYARFINQLEVIPGGNVILSDPYFFGPDNSVREPREHRAEAVTKVDESKLVLSSLICRPFDPSSLWPQVKSRFVGDTTCSVVLPECLKLLPDNPLKSLIDIIPKKVAIETFSSEFIGGQPGNYALEFWQISAWSDDWAVVYAGNDEGYVFPQLLGFCRRSDLERNFIRLLRAGSQQFDAGFYCTYGTIIHSGWKLSQLALSCEDDSSEQPAWDLIDDLLSFDDGVLSSVLREFQDGQPKPFISRLRKLRNRVDEIGLDDYSFSGLMDKAGGELSLGSIEEKIPKWDAEYEVGYEKWEKEQAALTTARENDLAPFRAEIDVWVEIAAGPAGTGISAIGRAARRGCIQNYLEDYVIENRKMPEGIHDFGCTDTYNIRVGIVNFDELASKAKFQNY